MVAGASGTRSFWRLWRWLLLWLWPCLAAGAPAGMTLNLPGDRPMALDRAAEVLVDPGGNWTLAQVRAAAGWQRLVPSQALPPAPAVVWLRWQVQVMNPPEGVIELPRRVVRSATLYLPDRQGGWVSSQAGEGVEAAQWPIPAPRVALPVEVHGPTEVLLRLSHIEPFYSKTLLWSRPAYGDTRALDHLWVGLFLGIALMALAYALGEALLRGDAVNGWYALHVLMTAVFLLVQVGYARMYLTEYDAALSQAARLIAGTLLAAVSLLFARRLLPKAFGGSRADAWALVVASFGVLLTASYVLWPGLANQPNVMQAQRAYYLLVLATVGLLLWSLRGVRLPYIRWYVTAFLAAAAGTCAELASDRGWLAAGGWAGHGMLVGAGVEIAVLTYALNFSARDLMHDPGTRREGARLDRWTGLLHSGELPGLLMSMSVRALRMNTQGAVLLLRLANLADLQRAHGSSITESAMKACARVIREASSPADVPLRLDDARFVVVLEQVQSRSEARALAQRILELGLQHHQELPELERLHFHAAIAHVPEDLRGDPLVLIDRLDQLSSQIRRGSASLIRSL